MYKKHIPLYVTLFTVRILPNGNIPTFYRIVSTVYSRSVILFPPFGTPHLSVTQLWCYITEVWIVTDNRPSV